MRLALLITPSYGTAGPFSARSDHFFSLRLSPERDCGSYKRVKRERMPLRQYWGYADTPLCTLGSVGFPFQLFQGKLRSRLGDKLL